MTQKKHAAILERLNNTAAIHTPGSWYHEDIPVLLDALESSEASVTLMKELLTDTEKRLHDRGMCAVIAEQDRDRWKAEAEAQSNERHTLKAYSDIYIAEREYWKSRAETLEREIYGDCTYCTHNGCKTPGGQYMPCACINGNAWQFDESCFVAEKNGDNP